MRTFQAEKCIYFIKWPNNNNNNDVTWPKIKQSSDPKSKFSQHGLGQHQNENANLSGYMGTKNINVLQCATHFHKFAALYSHFFGTLT